MSNAESALSLLARARMAANLAHCPYSNFHVGAAVLCDDGSVVDGCNVENASYGLSICAERVALFSALSQGKRPVSLAVSCVDAQSNDSAGSRMPCGACRQFLSEFGPDLEIIILEADGSLSHHSIGELLPYAFNGDALPPR